MNEKQSPHYTEVQLARLARGKGGEERHLAECAFCRERFEFFASFERFLKDEEAAAAEDPSATVPIPDREALYLQPAGADDDMLNLSPFALIGGCVAEPSGGAPVVFTSRNHHVTARATIDPLLRRITIQVFVEKSPPMRILSVEAVLSDGRTISVVTDEHGMADLGLGRASGPVAVDHFVVRPVAGA